MKNRTVYFLKPIFLIFTLIGFSSCDKHCEHSLVIDAAIDSTCTTTGLTEGSHCELCNEIIVPQEKIPAKGHKVIVDPKVEATCIEDGLTYGAHCEECGFIFQNQEIIEHNGHVIVLDQAKDATCVESGLTEGSHCDTCGEVFDVQEIIPAHGHSYVIDESHPATCEEDGITSGLHCSVCGEVFIGQHIIEHTGHKEVIDEAIEPTCTHSGLTQGIHCETCGEILVEQEYIEPLGHNYVVDKAIESTCSECGKTMGIHCSRCDLVVLGQECTDKKPHTKGQLISLPVEGVENVDNPGLFECEHCHEQFYSSIDHKDINLPVLRINGDLTNISKENKVPIKANYDDGEHDFDLAATLKWQGNLSTTFDKKNYNLQLYKNESLSSKQKIRVNDNWKELSKYTLKANWIDYSHARNIVSARLYGEIVQKRNIQDEFNSLFNGGAIDGFPIIIFQNGIYHGLYTMNLPKDENLFDMNGNNSNHQAILCTDVGNASNSLKEPIAEDFSNGWSLEYCSTGDSNVEQTQWVTDSFNEMRQFLETSSDEEFKNNVNRYINLPRAIDSMLYTWGIHATDNISKNMLWVTFDGKVWTPTMYDMDGTFGLSPYGELGASTRAWMAPTNNLLWERIWLNYFDLISIRWKEIRENILNIKHIDEMFTSFDNDIPEFIREIDETRWGDIPSSKHNNTNQIACWNSIYLINMDNRFGVTVDEEKPFKINFNSQDGLDISILKGNKKITLNNDVTNGFARDSNNGKLLNNGEGQIKFTIEIPENYEADIKITGMYKNIKYENGIYKITKINSDLVVDVALKEKQGEPPIDPVVPEGYKAELNYDNGVEKVLIYEGQNYELQGEETNVAYSFDTDLGEYSKSGNGQINFKVILKDGFSIDSVTATAGYKNLKDIGNGIFRITKITANITVTITTKIA